MISNEVEVGWRRLTGLDAAFLYAETPHTPLHVIGTLVLEPPRGANGDGARRIRRHVERRVADIPMLRRRLVEVPMGLDHPVWADDPRFDPGEHIRRVTLPAPATQADLDAFVARWAEQALPRDRPLWQIQIVEGLERDRVALVAKIHHAAVDGLGAVALLAGLLDGQPVPIDERLPALRRSAPLPSPVGLLADAPASWSCRPSRFARQVWDSAGGGARWLQTALAGQARPAPRTRLNCRVSGARAVATADVPLEGVKDVKNAFAATVNHVVLAGCAGALRRYLGEHGEIPREPLVAGVPMALGERAGDGMGNAISLLLVPLPVHLADALDRLHAVREASRAAIDAHTSGSVLAGWAEALAPTVLAGACRAYARLGLADRHPPLCNVMISNVPGPSESLWCGDARLAACRPLGPIYDGVALNITVLSYAGRIGIGAIACPHAVPELGKIPRGFVASIQQLRRIAESQRAERA